MAYLSIMVSLFIIRKLSGFNFIPSSNPKFIPPTYPLFSFTFLNISLSSLGNLFNKSFKLSCVDPLSITNNKKLSYLDFNIDYNSK